MPDKPSPDDKGFKVVDRRHAAAETARRTLKRKRTDLEGGTVVE